MVKVQTPTKWAALLAACAALCALLLVLAGCGSPASAVKEKPVRESAPLTIEQSAAVFSQTGNLANGGYALYHEGFTYYAFGTDSLGGIFRIADTVGASPELVYPSFGYSLCEFDGALYFISGGQLLRLDFADAAVTVVIDFATYVLAEPNGMGGLNLGSPHDLRIFAAEAGWLYFGSFQYGSAALDICRIDARGNLEVATLPGTDGMEPYSCKPLAVYDGFLYFTSNKGEVDWPNFKGLYRVAFADLTADYGTPWEELVPDYVEDYRGEQRDAVHYLCIALDGSLYYRSGDELRCLDLSTLIARVVTVGLADGPGVYPIFNIADGRAYYYSGTYSSAAEGRIVLMSCKLDGSDQLTLFMWPQGIHPAYLNLGGSWFYVSFGQLVNRGSMLAFEQTAATRVSAWSAGADAGADAAAPLEEDIGELTSNITKASGNQQVGYAELAAYYEQIVAIDAALAQTVSAFNEDYGAGLATREAHYVNFNATVVEPFCVLRFGAAAAGNDFRSQAARTGAYESLSVAPAQQDTYNRLKQLEDLLYLRIDLMSKTFERSLEFDSTVEHKDYINEYLAEVYVIVGDGWGGNNTYNEEFRALLPTAKPVE